MGSVTQITDNSGNLAAEYSYDAWGRMRNVSNWQQYTQATLPTILFGRGYTGHEHLNDFGLINMNARLYDPLLARFLALDPFVGSGMTNDFNRYVYCRNNPLMYTDPNGEWNFEVGWNSSTGLFYRYSNGNSGFYGNYNPNTSTFSMGSSYNGYNQSVQFPTIQSYSATSYHTGYQQTINFQQVGINSGTIEGEGDDLTFDPRYQLHEVDVTGQKQYKRSIGYPIFGELLSGKVDDRGYGPWNPDAIQLEGGLSANLLGIVNYTGGIGVNFNQKSAALYRTWSATEGFSHFDILKGITITPYVSINFLENNTMNNSLSLDVYKGGGVQSTLGLGPLGLIYGRGADFETALRTGPFAPTMPDSYNSYGLFIGEGVGFSRGVTKTDYLFQFNY